MIAFALPRVPLLAVISHRLCVAILGLVLVHDMHRAAASDPPPGAIVLFGGNDLAQWVGNGGAPGWNITNGVLTIVPGTGSLRTWQTFDDVQVHLEFRFLSNSPPGTAENALANSGVFLQDQFEIQIMDSYNRPLSGANDAGAIWSIRDANTNASLPGGMWETYDITFRAARWTNGVKVENARVTLRWNGVVVQDDVEIPRPTAGGAPPETPPPGPLMLQDLVGPVQFRNIWALPLTQPRPPGPESTTLVAAGSGWRYLDDGSDQGTAWRGPAFNDSSWNSGVAQFGYGDNDETTLIRSNRLNGTRIQTTYFRKPFVVTNRWAITNLAVSLLRDDGGIVYLNGLEVFRSNLTNAPVNYTNWALTAVNTADESRFFATNVNPALLVNGTNWLAVEIHQQSATSSDLGFDLRLTALAWQAPGIEFERAGNQLTLSWPVAPEGFVLETSPEVSPNLWSLETNAVVRETNGFHRASIANDGGTRFFRLRRAP